MARLRDVPTVLRTVGPIRFALRIWRQGSEDQLMGWAAALAYSWLFAVFPFFIFLMTLIPYLPDRVITSSENELREVVFLFPEQGAKAIWEVKENLLGAKTTSIWLRVTGLVLALWAASGGMSMTMTALDRCYELREGRSYIRHRLMAATLTVVIATLVLLIIVLLPIGGAVKAWIIRQNWYGLGAGSPSMIAFDIARWSLAVPFMISILTALYHFGPNVRHRFHWLTPGAIFSIVVWVLMGIGFKFYIEYFFNYNKTYGAVGTAVVMLLFFYINSAVLLWGAEINSEIDFEVLKVKRGTHNFLPAEESAAASPTDLFDPVLTSMPISSSPPKADAGNP